MDQPAGTLYAKVQYHDIQEHTLLTYTQMFSDETGRPSRHPMLPVFPEKLHTTVEFTKEAQAQTRVCVTCRPAGNVSPEEMEVFLQTRSGMTVGWTGSFDKLERLIEEQEKAGQGQVASV